MCIVFEQLDEPKLSALQDCRLIKHSFPLNVHDSFFSFAVGCISSRTKAEPSIYYSFSKPMDVDATLIEQQKEQVSFYLFLCLQIILVR